MFHEKFRCLSLLDFSCFIALFHRKTNKLIEVVYQSLRRGGRQLLFYDTYTDVCDRHEAILIMTIQGFIYYTIYNCAFRPVVSAVGSIPGIYFILIAVVFMKK
jgi:hypothetical protein